MNNQKCKVKPETINGNSDETKFFSFVIKTSKCSGSCNNVNDPYAKVYVSYAVNNINIKVFNLFSRTNKTRRIKRVNANLDQMQVFVVIRKGGMKINADVNVKN